MNFDMNNVNNSCNFTDFNSFHKHGKVVKSV